MGSAKAVAVLCFLATAGFAFLGCRGDLQDDADAVNRFLQTADPSGILGSRRRNASNICNWNSVVACDEKRSRVQSFTLQSLHLNGTFAKGTLDTMAQLRYLAIIDCGLSGPLPDLSQMHNLKHLYLDRNNFSADFPASIATLHRMVVISLSVNSLSGELPQGLAQLPRLLRLNLQQNRLSGSIPAFNQSGLYVFNVSYNNFSGQIPDTPALQRFNASSFQGNPLLCGNLLRKSCTPSASPEPDPTAPAYRPPAPGPTPAGSDGNSKGLDAGEIAGIVVACVVAVWAVVLVFCYVARKRRGGSGSGAAGDARKTTVSAEVLRREPEQTRLSIRKAMPGGPSVDMPILSFCGNEVPKYTLEDLLKASAEVLGRGSLGTSYKAVMEFMLIVAVKRLRYIKGDRQEFENYVESIGELRHPNLVPLRAYFQAKEERLIVFDYEPNGSLANLIYGAHHGSKGRPLHLSVTWRVAEDVARALWFLHQTARLAHGNLKPSNVLMGRHSEARLVDYALTPLHPDRAADAATSLAIYRPPESRTAALSVGPKADAYAYGVILLEMLAGEPPPPALLLNASVAEIPVWARAARADPAATAGAADGASIAAFDAHFSEKLDALVDVALRCVAFSPAQRPSMAAVLGLLEDGWDRCGAAPVDVDGDGDDIRDSDRYSDRY